MTLFCRTPEEIDARVSRGEIIGQIVANENLADLPNMLGDWNLRMAAGQGNVQSIVVAVPTNGRTRQIYQAGRMKWLADLGFSEKLSGHYVRGSAQVMYRWEEPVAAFVKKHLQMPEDQWYSIARDPNPLLKAKQAGIDAGLTRPRLMSALNILMNIWELAD
jgi:hypothetical protein